MAMHHIQDQESIDEVFSDAHRHAYNAAFEELGLNWHWDPVTFARLPQAGRDGVRAYLHGEQAHLLRAYESDFLVDAIETAKARYHQDMTRMRSYPGRHGIGSAESRMRAA
jgi:hypothetical protein